MNEVNRHQGSTATAQLTLIATGVLASLSISGGIISLFAHNWDSLPHVVRVILSMMPALMGIAVFSYAFLKHGGSKIWMESTSVFLMLMIGSSIGLVAQVYHLGGSFERFMLVWMIFTVPIIYLGRSSATSVLYLAGVVVWLMLAYADRFNFWNLVAAEDPYRLLFWLLVCAFLPHFFLEVKKGSIGPRALLLGWSMALLLFFFGFFSFTGHRFFNSMFFILLAYGFGKEYYGQGKFFWHRPFQTMAQLYIVSMSLIYAVKGTLKQTAREDGYMESYSNSYFQEILGGNAGVENSWNDVFSLLPLLAFVLLSGYFFRKQIKENKDQNYAIWIFPFVASLGLLLAIFEWPILARLVMVLYLLFLAGWYLIKGIEKNIPSMVNWGVFILTATLLSRYFDMNISFWLKGLLYLSIGGLVLLFNFYYSKKALNEK